MGRYGAGSGPIMLDNLRCRGNETSLLQCQNLGVNVHQCAHEQDVGVVCITTETQQGLYANAICMCTLINMMSYNVLACIQNVQSIPSE